MLSTSRAKPCAIERAEEAVSGLTLPQALRAPISRYGLLLPCLLFMLGLFVWPILSLLTGGVHSPEVSQALPQTSRAVLAWNGQGLPDDAAFEALIADLRAADRRAVAEAGRRLNYEIAGYRALILKTAARAASTQGRAGLIAIDPKWGEDGYWLALRRAASPITPRYLLAALDLEVRPDGSIGAAPQDNAIFLGVLGRTLWISLVVTVSCLLLAFPVAYHIASSSPRWRNLLLLLVLLPFWTSLLVRTSAWVVLLQDNGMINSVLLRAGLIETPLRLIFNRTGVYISFIHVMLPLMVLPLYSVMSSISKEYLRAAFSLGASGPRAFFKVYLPLVWPGIWSGTLLTFVVCSGYYVTPLLVGGNTDQMMSYFIAFYTKQTVNWGLAAALAIILSLAILLVTGLYALVGRRQTIVVKG